MPDYVSVGASPTSLLSHPPPPQGGFRYSLAWGRANKRRRLQIFVHCRNIAFSIYLSEAQKVFIELHANKVSCPLSLSSKASSRTVL
jgi:hypothetical protein